MSKLTLGQKADRVLKLLLGMRNARVVAALATRGFGTDDIEEGWKLLRSVARGRFDFVTAATADPGVILELDQWENTWFPVVDASLRRRYPAIAQRIFLNLSQTEGPGVVLTVGTLLERVDALSKATDEDSVGAMALLVRRGLTQQALDQARALLQSVGQTQPSAPVDLDTQREDLERAENDLWDWYLEWSQIARTSITERQLLRTLGFLTTTRSSSTKDDVDDEEPVAEPAPTSPSGFAPALGSQVSVKAS